MIRKELFGLKPLPVYRPSVDEEELPKVISTFCNMDVNPEDEYVYERRKGESPMSKARRLKLELKK